MLLITPRYTAQSKTNGLSEKTSDSHIGCEHTVDVILEHDKWTSSLSLTVHDGRPEDVHIVHIDGKSRRLVLDIGRSELNSDEIGQ